MGPSRKTNLALLKERETSLSNSSCGLVFHASLCLFSPPPVPPRVSAWLEWAGTTRVAVCVAAGGNPAATLTWRNAGNLTASNTTTQDPQGGLFTVRSTLELPGDGVGWEGVRCVVAHPSWETEVAIRPGDSGLLKGRSASLILYPLLLH